jgi:hypothetical protein
MPLPRRNRQPVADQPALPLDVGAAAPAPTREPRHRSRPRGEAPLQLSLEMTAADEAEGAEEWAPTEPSSAEPSPPTPSRPPSAVSEPAAEPLELDPDPPEFDPDPFADIPGFTPVPAVTREFVLLPGSLRGRLDLRELTRFLAALPTVMRDWDGAPEVDDGAVRLRGPEGGAWIYPEPNRVRVVTDGTVTPPLADDLVAVCRWLESRAGMQLYPAGEANGRGADRSLDPGDTFLGR